MVLALFLRWCRLKRPHIFNNMINTICRESKCKSRAELAKLAWAIMPDAALLIQRRKDGSCVPVISFNPSSSFPSFPFAWKGAIEKRKDKSDVSDFILKGAAFYAEQFAHHYKGNVHFYRECERVMICDWNRERLYYCISYLFPTCSHGSMFLLIFYSWRVMHYKFILYIGMLLTKWKIGCKAPSFLTKC